MDWLLHNLITEMRGPQFLFVYGLVIDPTSAVCKWRLRQSYPTASLPALWVPSTYDYSRQMFSTGNTNGYRRGGCGGCQDCFYNGLCRSGFKCLSYAMTGDSFQADPGCWVMSKKRKTDSETRYQ
jgi:hypothetical protein